MSDLVIPGHEGAAAVPAGRPRTAFVLAGGGSLGAVEVGMLEALVEHGVVPDLVVGSSVGAVNGAYFACRPNAEGVASLATLWRGLRRGDIFPISPFGSLLGLATGRNHFVDPARLRRLLEANLPCRMLSDTAVPLHVVAADLLSGEEVVVSSGSIVDAVMASAAIPSVFPPMRVDTRWLVDGAIASNTPLHAAVRLGAQRVVVLPTGFACSIPSPPGSAVAMALHALGLLVARQLVVDIERIGASTAVRVVPPLCPVSANPADFSRAAELIERGAAATRNWLAAGGLEHGGVPGGLHPHSHAPSSTA